MRSSIYKILSKISTKYAESFYYRKQIKTVGGTEITQFSAILCCDNMVLKLYKTDISGPTRAVIMTLEILKVNYETKDVDLMCGEHRTPEFLAKNPMHTLPMIEEDDFVLADSHAIITYLASKYGDEKLYPSDLRIRATVDQRLFFEATGLTKASCAIVVGVLRKAQKTPTPQQIEEVNASYEILEKYLGKTKFLACDHLTVADISCVGTITSTNYWVPIDEKYTNVKAWLNAVQKEDWYKKGNVPGLVAYEAFFNSRLNKSVSL